MTIDNHHNAVEDAVACGLITSKMLAQYDYDIQGFLDEYQYRMGKLFSHAFGVAKGGKSTPAKRAKTAAPLEAEEPAVRQGTRLLRQTCLLYRPVPETEAQRFGATRHRCRRPLRRQPGLRYPLPSRRRQRLAQNRHTEREP